MKRASLKKGKLLIDVNDMIGKRLGKLEVIRYDGMKYCETAGGTKLRHYYEVRCDCGTVKSVRRCTVKNETIVSCGCQRRRKHVHKDEEQQG